MTNTRVTSAADPCDQEAEISSLFIQLETVRDEAELNLLMLQQVQDARCQLRRRVASIT